MPSIFYFLLNIYPPSLFHTAVCPRRLPCVDYKNTLLCLLDPIGFSQWGTLRGGQWEGRVRVFIFLSYPPENSRTGVCLDQGSLYFSRWAAPCFSLFLTLIISVSPKPFRNRVISASFLLTLGFYTILCGPPILCLHFIISPPKIKPFLN